MSDLNTFPNRHIATALNVVMTLTIFALPTIPMLLTTIFPPTNHDCAVGDFCTESEQNLTYIAGGFSVLLGLVLVLIAWTSTPRARIVLLVVGLLVSGCVSGVLYGVKPWYIA